MNKIVRYNALLATALLLFAGCLRDSFDDCPRPLRVAVRAFCADDRDITTQGYVEQVVLFVFDHNEEFVDAFELCIDHVTNRRYVTLEFEYGNVPKFLIFDAWANVCYLVSFTQPNDVNSREDKVLRLNRAEIRAAVETRRADREAVLSPGDLFFGSLEKVRIDFGGAEMGIREYIVDVFRKTTQIHIITRGLREFNNNRVGDYRYEVHGGVDAINHMGAFAGDFVKKVPDAYFNAIGQFVTSMAFRKLILQYDSSTQNEDIAVDIFFNNELLHAVDRDSDGNPFIAELGRTLNIVIDLESDAVLNIRTIVTPWDVVWQEVDWVGMHPVGVYCIQHKN